MPGAFDVDKVFLPGVTQIDGLRTNAADETDSDFAAVLAGDRGSRVARRGARRRHRHGGSVGSTSANLWPLHIAIKKGFFAAANLKIDIVFAQSNASVIQQLAAGSLNVAPSAGLVDPIRAIDKGAPLALVRIVVQAPPYALLAKPAIKTIEDLKGKTISSAAPRTSPASSSSACWRRMGSSPASSTLCSPARPVRASRRCIRRGRCRDPHYAVQFPRRVGGLHQSRLHLRLLPDMPFAGMAVNRNWAAANPNLVEAVSRRLRQGHRLVRRPEEPGSGGQDADGHVSKIKQDDVEKAYDFLHDKHLFEPTGKVSKRKVSTVIDALRELGDVPADFSVDRLVLPGVTQMSD